jgi:predicted 2-oxoglutarate/Fe(II)-dependent dioxygenase YbiX
MGRHFDLHPFEGNETILSAVIYLNDDYEGGELYFDQQDITIKPKAGSVIFFPSTPDFTHASLVVNSGQKEAIPLFFYKYPEP